MSLYVTVSAKTHTVYTKAEFNFIDTTDTLITYPSPVYQVLNVNWSALLKGILPTLQSHSWSNGTNGKYQLGSGDLGFPHWLCGPLVCHWLLCGHYGCTWGVPNRGFCHLPPHPTQPSIINTDSLKGRQKYHEIQPSEIEKVNYNKNQ